MWHRSCLSCVREESRRRRDEHEAGKLRIGTSGYHYAHWRGAFYPRHLPQQCWFAYYARHFDTVELNNTFYRLPPAQTFETWREQAPQDFCYALKFSRYGSHLKRLQEPRASIARFLERASRLREHLGPILVQLPPHWRPDPTRLAGFLQAAPRDYHWAIELRDPRWLCDEVYALLKNSAAANGTSSRGGTRIFLSGSPMP